MACSAQSDHQNRDRLIGNWNLLEKNFSAVFLTTGDPSFKEMQLFDILSAKWQPFVIQMYPEIGFIPTIINSTGCNNTLPDKSLEYFEAQWKHSYFTFWFAGNCLAPTTTMYCHFNAFLMHSVKDEKYSLQCPKLLLHKIIYWDLSHFNTSH